MELDMADHTASVTRRLRGYLRLSMGGLIVLILAIGVWLGGIVRGARIHHDAVATIQKAGGRVRYDWEWTYGRTIQKREPWWPGWLGNVLGIDYFSHVTRVDFMNPATPVAVLHHVGRFGQLEWLQLAM
jgi:hypothetical protein